MKPNIVKTLVDATGISGDVDNATGMLTYTLGAWGIDMEVEKGISTVEPLQ